MSLLIAGVESVDLWIPFLLQRRAFPLRLAGNLVVASPERIRITWTH